MAKMIVMVDEDGNQVKKLADVEIEDADWEENCYRLGCQVAKKVAVEYLEEKAEQLDKERPPGYCVRNTNPRTLVTRFGDITFSRRLYQDRHGEYHFLLDEYLTKVGSAYQWKKIYCRGDDSIPFWDGASLEWHKWWDLGYYLLVQKSQ